MTAPSPRSMALEFIYNLEEPNTLALGGVVLIVEHPSNGLAVSQILSTISALYNLEDGNYFSTGMEEGG